MYFEWILLAVSAMAPSIQAQNSEISYECVCVPFTQCPNGTVVQYGQGIFSERIDAEQTQNITCSCESCDDVGMECCRLEKNSTTVPTTSPSVLPTQPPANVKSCGQRNIGGVRSGDRISSTGEDSESAFGEFPWVAAIFEEKQVNGKTKYIYQCVGSLIDRSVVLTAAHCVEGKTELGVKIGEWDVLLTNESLPVQNRAVKSVTLHEEYVPRLLHNDIALLVLEDPVDLAPHVGTICLPEQNERMDGRNCVVSGWGKDKFGDDGKNQRILKKVDLPIVSRPQCQEALQNVRFGPNFTLHPTFLCAGGVAGKDTCKGDGGAPLACPVSGSPNKYVQAGITAWGVGCGGTTPGVYIDVPRYRNWIDNKITILKMDARVIN